MLTGDCIGFSDCISMAKHRKIVTHVKWNCCERCAWAICSRRAMCILIRLSEIYSRDCLTKFDCDLITVEWPIVNPGRYFVAVWGLNSKLADSANLCLANDVDDIEKKSTQKPQGIKKSRLTFPLHTFFMQS